MSDRLDLPAKARAAVQALPDAEQERLGRQVEHARDTSQVELDEAVDAVVGIVPRWLRGRTRAILVGHR